MTASPTVIVLAAGQGTRMRSRVPKVLHDLCGRPLGLWPVRAALEAGAARVIVVDSPQRALAPLLPDRVQLVVQEHSDGTGGAVIAARAGIDPDAPVVVLSADVPLIDAALIRALAERHRESGAQASLLSAELEDPSGYGRVVRDSDGTVLRIVETKTPGDASEQELQIKEVNSGIYAFDGGALLSVLDSLDVDNAQRELYLTQALDLIRSGGGTVAAHTTDDPRILLGVNDRAALALVRQIAQQAINERHMRAGVGILDPASCYIDADVQIEVDATILPGTQLRGTTSVGEGATVGPHSTVIDSRIGAGSTVRVSWLERVIVGDEVNVGPFAYLRPGTELDDRSKVGTFVEVKNSRIGQGTKVPHLSYVGDADVGEHTNLGASTITANYDGRAKHRTRIGSGVHGGVHTSLIAPVEVGQDAWIAAGSVITDAVPPAALGIARARQSNIADYDKRNRRADDER